MYHLKNMKEYNIKEPLVDYPWKMEAIRILKWLKEQPKEYRSFVFDLCMSLAYIDSTSGLERHLQSCPSCPSPPPQYIATTITQTLSSLSSCTIPPRETVSASCSPLATKKMELGNIKKRQSLNQEHWVN